MPHDLAQIALIDLLSAVRAVVEMAVFADEVATVQFAGNGRAKV